jgi:hypothetical protein
MYSDFSTGEICIFICLFTTVKCLNIFDSYLQSIQFSEEIRQAID